MAIALTVSANATGNSTAAAITVPSGVLGGDLVIVRLTQLWASSGVSFTSPGGLTALQNQVSNGNSLRSDDLYFQAAGTVGSASSDVGSTFTFTLNATRGWMVTLDAYSGTDPTTPIPSGAFASATDATTRTTHVAPSVTAVAGGWVWSACADKGSGSTFTPPSGYTTRSSAKISSGPAQGTCTADTNGTVSAGTVSPGTWTSTGSSANSTVATIALSPAASSAIPATAAGTVTALGSAVATGSSVASASGAVTALGSGAATASGSGTTASGTVTARIQTGSPVTPQLDVNFDDGTTGAFTTVQGATVGPTYAHDGPNGVRLAPAAGTNYATLTLSSVGGSHPWAAFRCWFRVVTKTNPTNTYTNLFEIGNTLSVAPKGQFTVYTKNGDLVQDFNTTDVQTIDPGYAAGSWHFIEARVFFGATTFTSYVRYDGVDQPVHTSAATQTAAYVNQLWMNYPSTATDQTVDFDGIKLYAGDTDPGWLDSVPLVTSPASASGTVTATGTATPGSSGAIGASASGTVTALASAHATGALLVTASATVTAGGTATGTTATPGSHYALATIVGLFTEDDTAKTPLVGQVTISCDALDPVTGTVAVLGLISETPARSVAVLPVVATLVAGAMSVTKPGTGQAGVTKPSTFTYTARFSLTTQGGVPVRIAPYSFAAPAGVTTSLTSVAP